MNQLTELFYLQRNMFSSNIRLVSSSLHHIEQRSRNFSLALYNLIQQTIRVAVICDFLFCCVCYTTVLFMHREVYHPCQEKRLFSHLDIWIADGEQCLGGWSQMTTDHNQLYGLKKFVFLFITSRVIVKDAWVSFLWENTVIAL